MKILFSRIVRATVLLKPNSPKRLRQWVPDRAGGRTSATNPENENWGSCWRGQLLRVPLVRKSPVRPVQARHSTTPPLPPFLCARGGSLSPVVVARTIRLARTTLVAAVSPGAGAVAGLANPTPSAAGYVNPFRPAAGLSGLASSRAASSEIFPHHPRAAEC